MDWFSVNAAKSVPSGCTPAGAETRQILRGTDTAVCRRYPTRKAAKRAICRRGNTIAVAKARRTVLSAAGGIPGACIASIEPALSLISGSVRGRSIRGRSQASAAASSTDRWSRRSSRLCPYGAFRSAGRPAARASVCRRCSKAALRSTKRIAAFPERGRGMPRDSIDRCGHQQCRKAHENRACRRLSPLCDSLLSGAAGGRSACRPYPKPRMGPLRSSASVRLRAFAGTFLA